MPKVRVIRSPHAQLLNTLMTPGAKVVRKGGRVLVYAQFTDNALEVKRVHPTVFRWLNEAHFLRQIPTAKGVGRAYRISKAGIRAVLEFNATRPAINVAAFMGGL